MPPSPKPLQHLLREGPLFALKREALEQQSWLVMVKELLPESLRLACLGCVLKGDVLVIQMSSSSFATLLRFQAPLLLKALKDRKGKPLRTIEVRTHVGVLPRGREAPMRKPCPKTTSQHLRAYAEQAPSDDMAAALRRLVDTLERRGIPQGTIKKRDLV